MNETFRMIKGFSKYVINPEGTIICIEHETINTPRKRGDGSQVKYTKYYTERECKPTINKTSGYACICVMNDEGKRETLYIHRALCLAFKDQPTGANYVDHIDGNKQNNNLSNLEWVTASTNIRRSWKRKLALEESK